MKKTIVFLLLALAVIIGASPRLVGELAEQSLDASLNRAALDTGDFTITSLGFDRRWFSSEGRHRVEISDGDLRDSLLELAFEGDLTDLPALIIDTRIDHGLVPVTSIGRENGSLVPGLGSTVSQLSFEFANGEPVQLPITVYSHVGITGSLESNLVVEPGYIEVNDETAHWGNADIIVSVSPYTSVIGFSGTVDELRFVSASNDVSVGGISFHGDQQPTRFGIAVGDAELSVETIAFPSRWGRAEAGPLRITSAASIDAGRATRRAIIDVDYFPFPDIGPAAIRIDTSINDIDAAAIAGFYRTIANIDSYGSDDRLALAVENHLQELLAGGFSWSIDTFDLRTPMGTLSASLDTQVAPTVVDRFVMASMLLALDARLDLSIPAEFFDYLVTLDPQVNVAAAMGFLRRDGDSYEMQAEFRDALLTINGAPLPIPLQDGN